MSHKSINQPVIGLSNQVVFSRIHFIDRGFSIRIYRINATNIYCIVEHLICLEIDIHGKLSLTFNYTLLYLKLRL